MKPSPAEQAIAQMRKKLHRRLPKLRRWVKEWPELWMDADAYHAADKPRKPSTGTTIAVKCGREAPQESPRAKVPPDSGEGPTK